MTATVYVTATTLDGFIADEHDSLDWLFVQEIDEHGPMNHADFMAGVGSLVMGATTYAWVLAHLRAGGGEWEYRQPCWVLTHRDPAELGVPDRADVRFASGDVRPVHNELLAAAGGADVWVVGGGDLAGQLADHGLLDEVIVSIAPVTLGSGRPLFPRRHDLRLIELARNGAFACARYAIVGPRG